MSADDIAADYQEEENVELNESYSTDPHQENTEELAPEEMQKRVLEMEEELQQLSKLQEQVESQISTASDKIDENSMYDVLHRSVSYFSYNLTYYYDTSLQICWTSGL